jgi:hypothetical protein
VNTYGNELLAHLPNVFGGNNDYGSGVFFRFKHRVDALDEKIGLKVGENKNLMVKDYQDRLHSRAIIVSEHETIQEMTTFIKHTTTAGNVRYAADGSSHDDTVMTLVNLTAIYGKNDFKGIVEDLFTGLQNTEIQNLIEEVLKRVEYTEGVDYKQLLDVRRRHLTSSRRIQEARKGWGLEG